MKKTAKILVWGLFIYYLLLLTWIILFKTQFSLAALDRYRIINWIPLAESAYPDGRVNVSELFNNVLVFVPLGIYLSMLAVRWPFYKKLLTVFGVSLAFELLQYALAVGVSDVTDLIGNTLGGLIGLGLYALALRLKKDRARTDRLFVILAFIASLGCTALILLLFLANGGGAG